MADNNAIEDTRPENTQIFEGVERKFFTLATFNNQPTATHTVDGKQSPCTVYLPHDPRCTREILESMPAYKNWLTQLLYNLALQDKPNHIFHNNPHKLKTIDVQAPTWFPGQKLGFLKAQCTIETDDKAQWLPGAVFLRGGSVGVLIIIQPHDGEDQENLKLHSSTTPELYTLLTLQPRIAASTLSFPELPAGMLDATTHDLQGKAAAEIREETALTINASDLFNMSAAACTNTPLHPYAALDTDDSPPEQVADAMYPSPGGCDEFLPLMLLQKRMSRVQIEALKSRKTGLRDEGEVITLKVVRFEELWREGARDAKCLAALGLYENLKRVGGLPAMPAEPDDG